MQKSISDTHIFQSAQLRQQFQDPLSVVLLKKTLPRSGGPQKLEENEKSHLFQAIEENPQIKYEALLALVNYKVSRQTIWRLLQKAH